MNDFNSFKKKYGPIGISDDELMRKYMLRMLEEDYRAFEAAQNAEASATAVSAAGGGAAEASAEEIDTLFPNWRTNNLDGSVFLTALNTQISLSTFDPSVINTIGTFPGTNQTARGINAPNGKVYILPNVGNLIYEFDPETQGVVTFAAPTGGYPTGCLAPNGKIYSIPNGVGERIIEIDPNSRSVTQVGPVFDSTSWGAPVVATNGKIYAAPAENSRVIEFDPSTYQVDFFGTFATGGSKWYDSVLAPNGKIYGIPAFTDTILEIDPATKTTANFGSFALGSSKWFGGVLGANGKVYGIPRSTNTVLEIDPTTQGITLFGNYVGSNKWVEGVLAPNGKIYCIPRNATQILEIDPATQGTALIGSVAAGSNKWAAGILAKNGKIYGFPEFATSLLEIGVTQPSPLPSNMILSRYINKT